MNYQPHRTRPHRGSALHPQQARAGFVSPRRFVAAVLMTGLLVGLVGCDGKRLYQVSGKLLDNGQPLRVSDKGSIRVSFAFAQNPDGSFMGTAEPDGTFKIPGPGNGGIPAASYRVGVEQLDPYPDKDLL
jgi:hypothetical protein